MAARAAVIGDGSREYHLSQLDRTQGVPLHIPVGGPARHHRGAGLGGLDPVVTYETRLAAIGAAVSRWWVGADLGGACGDRHDAGLLDERHRLGATGGGTTRRSSALWSCTVQYAFPS